MKKLYTMPKNLTDINFKEVKIYEIKKHFGDDDTKELLPDENLSLFGLQHLVLGNLYTNSDANSLCEAFDSGEIDLEEFQEEGGESLRFENWAADEIIGFDRSIHNKDTLIFYCDEKSYTTYRINFWDVVEECDHVGDDLYAQFEILVKFTDQDGIEHSNF
jgi:hypothetical protein